MYYSNLTLDNSLHQTAPNIHMLGGKKANKTKKKPKTLHTSLAEKLCLFRLEYNGGKAQLNKFTYLYDESSEPLNFLHTFTLTTRL